MPRPSAEPGFVAYHSLCEETNINVTKGYKCLQNDLTSDLTLKGLAFFSPLTGALNLLSFSGCLRSLNFDTLLLDVQAFVLSHSLYIPYAERTKPPSQCITTSKH